MAPSLEKATAPLYPAGIGGLRDMIDEEVPPRVADSHMGPTRSGDRTFSDWLDVQLRARRLTQRQLAQKSGVDHSTISRLMRGDRTPSLRTAALLTHGLGMADGLDWIDRHSVGRAASPAAGVEHALRLDDFLSETQVRAIMDVYLATRLRRLRSAATPAPAAITPTTPVPIVVQAPGVRPRSATIRRVPTAARGRSS
jgi:transcriptional regulator with XRE-family HTH domain